MTDFAEGAEDEAGLAAAHAVSPASAAPRDDAGAVGAETDLEDRMGAGAGGAAGAGGVCGADGAAGAVVRGGHAADPDRGGLRDVRGAGDPPAAVPDGVAASWRVRCHRRHVCETACAVCSTHPCAEDSAARIADLNARAERAALLLALEIEKHIATKRDLTQARTDLRVAKEDSQYWYGEMHKVQDTLAAERAALVEEIVKRVERLDTQAHADFKALVLDTIRGVAVGEEG